jgi:glycosyltransferase involved in cell wall biosynthesis
VLERLPEARLALVGDGPHRAALEEHFAGTSTTFAGRLDGAELAAAYASADCFVFPSTSETLGLVVLEAMASGTPVVAARAGGIPDLVRHGEDGFLLDADDADAWASRIRRLLGDGSLRERVSRRARAAAERWSWAAATADLRRHYVAVLGARAAAA